MSMNGCIEVRVMPYNTFRLNVCDAMSTNALGDFGRAEMNCSVPQSLQTHHELQALAAVPLHVLSPRRTVMEDKARSLIRGAHAPALHQDDTAQRPAASVEPLLLRADSQPHRTSSSSTPCRTHRSHIFDTAVSPIRHMGGDAHIPPEDGKANTHTRHDPHADVSVQVSPRRAQRGHSRREQSLLVWKSDAENFEEKEPRLMSRIAHDVTIKTGACTLPTPRDATATFRKAMKAAESHANYKEHNDVVLDPIKSIDIIGVEEHPKLYDVTVPSTLNFILANGLGCRDTSDTGYIYSFLYGEDGMNATSLEFHSLPYMTLASPADMRPEYLLATREELVGDLRFVSRLFCHGSSGTFPHLIIPVNFSRIVEDSSALLGAKSATDELAGPDSILDTIDDLISAMVFNQAGAPRGPFHRRGSQAATTFYAATFRVFPRLRELLSMTKKIKTPTMALQLRPEHSASIERAKDVMSDIQTTLLKDVVRSSAIYFDPHDDERSVVLADHGLLAFHKKYCLLVNNDGGQSSP
eukprot:gene32327-biopygen4409